MHFAYEIVFSKEVLNCLLSRDLNEILTKTLGKTYYVSLICIDPAFVFTPITIVCSMLSHSDHSERKSSP